MAFARAGHAVAVWAEDRNAAGKAIDFIASILPDLAANDLLDGAAPETLLARFSIERDLSVALTGAEHVQENTPERLDLKKRVFADLDRLRPPPAAIPSSTCSLRPSP